jgi:phosphoglycerate dehydrogenase-like enzyme
MDVIAWSQNLAEARAAEYGVRLITKDALFHESDFLSVNVMLSERTLNLVRAREIALMKPTAFLINTTPSIGLPHHRRRRRRMRLLR